MPLCLLLLLFLPGCYREAPPAPAYTPKTLAFEANNRAVAAFKAGNLEQALAEAETAVKEDPAFVTAQVTHATLLCRIGRNDEALRAVEALLSRDANNPHALLLRGLVLEHKQNTGEARSAYERAAVAFTDCKDTDANPMCRLNRAIALYLAKGTAAGLLEVNALLAEYPAFDQARFVQGRMVAGDREIFLDWLVAS